MMRINWNPNSRELRMFGLVVLVGGLVISATLYFTGNKEIATDVCIFAVTLGAIGLSGTKLALPFYRIWMGIAFVIGGIMNRVLLTLVYFGIVTPIGIARRAMGNDRLQLKKPVADTYWMDSEQPAPDHDYERQS